jgi:enoyl-CoA hydratase/carnithine racemase
MSKQLLYEKTGNIAVITINNQSKDNILSPEMAQQLIDYCSALADEAEIKALIITGSGEKSFCKGQEYNAMPVPVSASIAAVQCPVIAVINGDAFSGGLEIALACDIRIAAPQARFCLPAVESGKLPADGGTQRLPRIIGITRAMEMALTGESIDAAEAFKLGLVSRLIEPGKLLAGAKEMAQVMTTRSPLALSYAKEAINKGLDLTLEQGLRLEADLYFLLHTTEDRSEGIKAFREKRKPQFKGK